MDNRLAKILVEIVNEEGGDCQLREGYSGRGMNGETTSGIVGTSVSEVLSSFMTSTIDDSDLIKDFCEGGFGIPTSFKEDSMGMSDILY